MQCEPWTDSLSYGRSTFVLYWDGSHSDSPYLLSLCLQWLAMLLSLLASLTES